MSFDLALRCTEILLGLALLQSSLEHLVGPQIERWLFGARIPLCILLICGLGTSWVLVGLMCVMLAALGTFDGPYNGGSDRMVSLILLCLTGAHLIPWPMGQQALFGYLAVQVILSYFIAGQVKVSNPEWRSGHALRDVFAFSAYPMCEASRALAYHREKMWIASWAVIVFELTFPLALYSQTTLVMALIFAAGFHAANALLFGLNRFVWAWLASYPSLLWFQDRFIQVL